MKLPIDSYAKLYNSFLYDEFPNIESISLKPASIWKKIGDLGIGADFIINIQLKEYKGKDMRACITFGRKLSDRIIELNNYLGLPISRDIKIYHNGKLICTDDDFYVGKK